MRRVRCAGVQGLQKGQAGDDKRRHYKPPSVPTIWMKAPRAIAAASDPVDFGILRHEVAGDRRERRIVCQTRDQDTIRVR